MKKPRLTTKLACNVVRRNSKLDRTLAERFTADRLNEAIAAGDFPCAPETVRGRSRYFEPDDMTALWLFLELMDDGFRPDAAGRIACAVANVARAYPDAPAVTYVRDYFTGHGAAYPAFVVPESKDWNSVYFGGTDIRSAMTFRISKTRDLIAYYTNEATSEYGEED
jgi:hypothetical protein